MTVKLKDLWRKSVKDGGMFGAELEVESNTKLPNIDNGTWKTERDPSLRSAFPFEYVTRSPIPFVGVERAITNLLNRLSDKEVSDPIKDSPTTSWHIHLNTLEFTPKELMTKLFLYWVLEPLIIKHCGKNRQQNTFAIQLKDAYSILSRFNTTFYTTFITNPASVVRSGTYSSEQRYCAQNMSALSKFGSLEYRAMKGTLSQEEIMQWIDILIMMWCDKKLTNPSEVLSMYYDKGSVGTLQEITNSTKFDKYWNKDVEEHCEENALALLDVDDNKMFPWELWDKKIGEAHDLRKYQEYDNETPPAPPAPRPRSPLVNRNISGTRVISEEVAVAQAMIRGSNAYTISTNIPSN